MTSRALVFLFSTTLGAQAAVYGTDTRELVTTSTPAKIQELGLSVAAMIARTQIESAGDNRLVLRSEPLGDSDNLCSGERFADEPTVSDCTGFLVGPDLLMTAGHCVKDPNSCQGHVWLFNNRRDLNPSTSDVYDCLRIEKTEIANTVDYALVRLNRLVEGRKPLKLSKTSSLTVGANVFSLSYPTGLPLVYAPGGIIWSLTPSFLTASLNTFHKSSGSPVFNSASNEVEGMLVYGSIDYKMDFGGIFSPKCNRVYVCNPGDKICIGEGALRADDLQEILASVNLSPEH
jgi:hypothetical protein